MDLLLEAVNMVTKDPATSGGSQSTQGEESAPKHSHDQQTGDGVKRAGKRKKKAQASASVSSPSARKDATKHTPTAGAKRPKQSSSLSSSTSSTATRDSRSSKKATSIQPHRHADVGEENDNDDSDSLSTASSLSSANDALYRVTSGASRKPGSSAQRHWDPSRHVGQSDDEGTSSSQDDDSDGHSSHRHRHRHRHFSGGRDSPDLPPKDKERTRRINRVAARKHRKLQRQRYAELELRSTELVRRVGSLRMQLSELQQLRNLLMATIQERYKPQSQCRIWLKQAVDATQPVSPAPPSSPSSSSAKQQPLRQAPAVCAA